MKPGKIIKFKPLSLRKTASSLPNFEGDKAILKFWQEVVLNLQDAKACIQTMNLFLENQSATKNFNSATLADWQSLIADFKQQDRLIIQLSFYNWNAPSTIKPAKKNDRYLQIVAWLSSINLNNAQEVNISRKELQQALAHLNHIEFSLMVNRVEHMSLQNCKNSIEQANKNSVVELSDVSYACNSLIKFLK